MRVDLNEAVTLASIRDGLVTLWNWWTGQLRGLLPQYLGEHLDRTLERWTISVGEQQWQLRRRAQDSERIALDMEAPASTVHDLIERLEPGALARRLTVIIPASDVLIRRIRIPASAGAHMRSVVRLQLDRLSPFSSDDVHFDCRKEDAGDGEEIDVTVGVVQKTTLRNYEDRLASIGLVAGQFEVADSGLSFRPARLGWTSQERNRALLVAAAGAAWIAVLVLAPTMRDSELSGLSAEVAALRAPALRAEAARDELDRLARPLAAASNQVARPNALDTLLQLTTAIPLDAQITSLVVDGNAIRLVGRAPSPNAVILALKNSHEFRAAKLVASPAHGAEDPTFELEAAVNPLSTTLPR